MTMNFSIPSISVAACLVLTEAHSSFWAADDDARLDAL